MNEQKNPLGGMLIILASGIVFLWAIKCIVGAFK